ncbi:MAG TPA: hypothetical protein VII64_02500 [Thermodesulfobacteriota bacterium]
MYAEVLYDSSGNIKACYCVDTLPVEPSAPMLRFFGVPEGLTHARLNIDTAAAMEIEGACSPHAELDQAGNPVIVSFERAAYIMETFAADPGAVTVAGGMSLVGLQRKGA